MALHPITIDNVGITAIICRRSLYQRTITRKFKASCGSKIEFTISTSGNILDVKKHHELCRQNCIACETQTSSAKKLIESGK